MFGGYLGGKDLNPEKARKLLIAVFVILIILNLGGIAIPVLGWFGLLFSAIGVGLALYQFGLDNHLKNLGPLQ